MTCKKCGKKRIRSGHKNTTGYCQACLREVQRGKRLPCTTPGCHLTATEDALEGKCRACLAREGQLGSTFAKPLKDDIRRDYDCAESPTRRHYWIEQGMGTAWYRCRWCHRERALGERRLVPIRWDIQPVEKRE